MQMQTVRAVACEIPPALLKLTSGRERERRSAKTLVSTTLAYAYHACISKRTSRFTCRSRFAQEREREGLLLRQPEACAAAAGG